MPSVEGAPAQKIAIVTLIFAIERWACCLRAFRPRPRCITGFTDEHHGRCGQTRRGRGRRTDSRVRSANRSRARTSSRVVESRRLVERGNVLSGSDVQNATRAVVFDSEESEGGGGAARAGFESHGCRRWPNPPRSLAPDPSREASSEMPALRSNVCSRSMPGQTSQGLGRFGPLLHEGPAATLEVVDHANHGRLRVRTRSAPRAEVTLGDVADALDGRRHGKRREDPGTFST